MSDDDYLWDKSGKPDPDVARLESLLEPMRYKARVFDAPATDKAPPADAPKSGPAPLRVVRRMSSMTVRWTLAAAAVFALASGAIFVIAKRENAPLAVARPSGVQGMDWSVLSRAGNAFDVQRLAGAPLIAERRVASSGRLGVGEWLETDSASRARIAIASIGHVEVGANTRVRLVTTGETEHRLDLARGTIQASVDAPPRLFIVGTPAATAVDLGCEYTLEVDEAGSGSLRVTSGWVALETGDRASLVPAGAMCKTAPGKGPGTPYFEDASAKLQEALASLDFKGGGLAELRTVIAAARARDSLTLWHLLFRVEESMRREIFARLQQLAPPPKGVGEPQAVELDRPALDRWKDDLKVTW